MRVRSMVTGRLSRFAWHVLRRFYAHRGLLLSGAVAYNVLLSVMPLGGLVLAGLSRLVDRETLLRVFSAELEHVMPGQAVALTQEVTRLWEHSELVGGVSLAMMVFFGTLAFRVLGEAMTAIFVDVPRAGRGRGFLASAAIPFVFVGVILTGLIGLTLLFSFLQGVGDRSWTVFGLELSMHPDQQWALLAGGLFTECFLFACVYLVLSGVKVRTRDAVIAALVATVLWETVRRLLIWYFASISTIGVVYGSLATVVIALMSAEIAAIILLLGAQVLAELTVARHRRIPWYELVDAKAR